jgi:hypothetical protein
VPTVFGHHWIVSAFIVLLEVNLVALIGQQIVGRWYKVQSRRMHEEILGHIAGITGVINAVLFAFIVFVAWTRYDRAGDTVDQEVSLIWQIWHDVESAEPKGHPMEDVIPEALHHQIAAELRWYVNEVTDREWQLMQSKAAEEPGYRHKFEAGTDSLRAAYENVLRVDMKRGTPRTLITEIIKRFNSLFEVRRQRIAFSVEGAIPFIVWMSLLGGGLLCVACCWLIGFKDLNLHALITGVIASSFAIILFLIMSLNTPFRGAAAISNLPFRALQVDIERWEEREKLADEHGQKPEVAIVDREPR